NSGLVGRRERLCLTRLRPVHHSLKKRLSNEKGMVDWSGGVKRSFTTETSSSFPEKKIKQ
ncbi:MAG: hypothetical protein QCI82_08670, partial [Candidatus Thermoplasmatota archaeon]|nr:hypothetical protein [Candidatus Thermoplasmatota archaeon]